ncbi:hypothetical protein HZB69_04270 [Candidatus Amesbacteria bacterium]|nr:hypothetical protein [Candidatus Amesbacteria bacterium]
MNKQCPFCKKTIDKASVDCPYCKRIIIEHIGLTIQKNIDTSANTYTHRREHKNKTGFIHQIKSILSKLNVIQILNNNNFSFDMNYLWVIPIAVFVIVALRSPKIQSLNTLNNESNPNNYRSLPNGTVIKTINSNGLGRLRIDNGTDYHAIAKLKNNQNRQSVFTVYIQRSSSYTLGGISDGTYELFFHLGNDWDDEKSKFLVNPSYAKFRDDFVFSTTVTENFDSVRTRYSEFQITLNPVVGGTAKTNTVSRQEFEKY